MRRNIHYKPSKSASILSGIIACAMGVFGLFAIPSIGAMIGFKAIWCLMTFGMGIYNFLLAAGLIISFRLAIYCLHACLDSSARFNSASCSSRDRASNSHWRQSLSIS